MKLDILKILLYTILISSGVSCRDIERKQNTTKNPPDTELIDIQNWFNAWEMTAERILNIKPHDAPTILLFDQKYLYTNSPRRNPDGTQIQGPTFFEQKLAWNKIKHNDTIQLPNGQKLPVGLLSFAVPIDHDEYPSFFVMALPSMWHSAKVESKKLGNNNFYTTIFLHEFAHSHQTNNFGKKLQEFANTYQFENDLNDDMIQADYKNDSLYANNLKSEIQILYDAYFAKTESEMRNMTKKGLKKYKERQNRFFVGDKEVYRELDDFFLTMEGIGQYVSFGWLTSENGANLTEEVAIEGLRRKKENWAQEEGFALFLIYSRLTEPNLEKEMFGDSVFYITDLIENHLKQ